MRRRRLPGNGGFVYAIGPTSPSSLVKLGRTRDPDGIGSRLGSLRAQSPVDLACFAAIPCIDKNDLAATEWALHDLFKAERCHGEWFTRSAGIESAIAKIVRTFGRTDGAAGVPETIDRLRRVEEHSVAAAEHWTEITERWRRRYFSLTDIELPPPPLPPSTGFYDDNGAEWDGTGFQFVNLILRSELVRP
jgi:Meiotically up-regulated gene 113